MIVGNTRVDTLRSVSFDLDDLAQIVIKTVVTGLKLIHPRLCLSRVLGNPLRHPPRRLVVQKKTVSASVSSFVITRTLYYDMMFGLVMLSTFPSIPCSEESESCRNISRIKIG